MAIRVVTPPAYYPITLAELKDHLNVTHTDQDDLIEAYLAAAVSHAEVFTGRAFVNRTLELVLDAFQDQIEIPKPPLVQVNSITYLDSNGDTQVLVEDTDFAVDTVSQPGWVVQIDDWPDTLDRINAVTIQYVAGYGDDGNSPPTSNTPADIKAAIKLIAGSLYGVRETVIVGTSVAAVPWSAEQILRQHRVELSLA